MAIELNTEYTGVIGTAFGTNGGTTRPARPVYYAYSDLYSDNPTVDDAVYFWTVTAGPYYTGIYFNNSAATWIVSDAHTIVWEYYDGSMWKELPNISDGTNGFIQGGYVTWDLPTDWEMYDYLYGSSHYRLWWVRARLSSFTNITQGGNIFLYPNYTMPRPHTIKITAQAVTPASLKAASDSGGWNAVTTDNDKKYIFPYGFILDADSTITINGESLQFGTPEAPAFTLPLIAGAKWIVNAATYGPYDWGSHIEFYCSNMDGYDFYFGSSAVGAEFNNCMISLYYTSKTACYGPIYRLGYMGAYAPDGKNFNLIFNCQMIPWNAGAYERCSFLYPQYVLSSPAATYKNILVNKRFTMDGGYTPAMEDSTFTGNSETSQWYTFQLSTGNNPAYAGYLEVIDCFWPNGNMLVPDAHWDNTVYTADFYFRTLYMHKFNLMITNTLGQPIEGASISLVDTYGNESLYSDVDGAYVSVSETTDDSPTIRVNDPDLFTIGKYYLLLGEIVLCTGKTGLYDIEVDRGQKGTVSWRYRSRLLPAEKTRILEDNLMTDSSGLIPDCLVMENFLWRKQQTYVFNAYSPFTLIVEKDGYDTYTSSFDITERTNLVIALKETALPIYVDRNMSGSIDTLEVTGALSDTFVSGDIETISLSGNITEVTLSGAIE